MRNFALHMDMAGTPLNGRNLTWLKYSLLVLLFNICWNEKHLPNLILSLGPQFLPFCRIAWMRRNQMDTDDWRGTTCQSCKITCLRKSLRNQSLLCKEIYLHLAVPSFWELVHPNLRFPAVTRMLYCEWREKISSPRQTKSSWCFMLLSCQSLR